MEVGIIGFGKMGMLHAGVLNAFKDVTVTCISDSSKAVLNSLETLNPSIKVYNDYVEMLEKSKPEAVFITTPNHLHVPMALECGKRNIPFFIEKPLSSNCENALPLVRFLEENPMLNMVGYMTRFMDTFLKGQEILATGVLGDVVDFHATMYVSQLFKKGKGWRYGKEFSGGGVVITQNSHLIDMLTWYFGNVKAVNARTKSVYSNGMDDFAHVYMEFESGLTGWYDASWSVMHHRLVEIKIHVEAKNGTLTVDDDYARLYLKEPGGGFPEGWSVFSKPDLYKGVEVDVGGPQYTMQNRSFINALKNGDQIKTDVDAGFEIQKVTDAIYKSASRQGQQVELSRLFEEGEKVETKKGVLEKFMALFK